MVGLRSGSLVSSIKSEASWLHMFKVTASRAMLRVTRSAEALVSWPLVHFLLYAAKNGDTHLVPSSKVESVLPICGSWMEGGSKGDIHAGVAVASERPLSDDGGAGACI